MPEHNSTNEPLADGAELAISPDDELQLRLHLGRILKPESVDRVVQKVKHFLAADVGEMAFTMLAASQVLLMAGDTQAGVQAAAIFRHLAGMDDPEVAKRIVVRPEGGPTP